MVSQHLTGNQRATSTHLDGHLKGIMDEFDRLNHELDETRKQRDQYMSKCASQFCCDRVVKQSSYRQLSGWRIAGAPTNNLQSRKYHRFTAQPGRPRWPSANLICIPVQRIPFMFWRRRCCLWSTAQPVWLRDRDCSLRGSRKSGGRKRWILPEWIKCCFIFVPSGECISCKQT